MNTEEFYFYEWIIILKKFSPEKFSKITNKEFQDLKEEYKIFNRIHKKAEQQ